MAKVFTYLFVIAGLILMFNVMGIPTLSNKIITYFGVEDPENLNLSVIAVLIAGIFAGVTASAITIGYLTKSSPETILLIGYAEILLLFTLDIIGVIIYVYAHYEEWVATCLSLFLVPIAIGYFHAVVSWWGGRD